jgi:hypothetical protein
MVTYNDTAYLFAYAKANREPAIGARLAPTITADGDLVPEPADGSNFIHARAIQAARYVSTIEFGNDPNLLPQTLVADHKEHTLFISNDFELVVTDARVAIIANRPEKNGTRLVGQIRFPWIAAVGFHPKQSFLIGSEIVIQAIEEFDVEDFPVNHRGVFRHILNFVFDKRFHPGALAQQIVQRAAKYVASTQNVPESAQLQSLQRAHLLPDPPKGAYSIYEAAVFCPVPQGRYFPGDSDEGTCWSE